MSTYKIYEISSKYPAAAGPAQAQGRAGLGSACAWLLAWAGPAAAVYFVWACHGNTWIYCGISLGLPRGFLDNFLKKRCMLPAPEGSPSVPQLSPQPQDPKFPSIHSIHIIFFVKI